ncbi:MAG: hypothetical protein RLZZ224_1195 [Verrucomicrobiota bacterium]|jgi:hypothetical protein
MHCVIARLRWLTIHTLPQIVRMSKRGKTRRVPIARREGEVLGENDGEFLTEFQNFSELRHGRHPQNH